MRKISTNNNNDVMILYYKGYEGKCDYDAEDDIGYYGRMKIRTEEKVGILCYSGMTLEEVQKDFEECIDDFLWLYGDKKVKWLNSLKTS